VFAEKSHAYFFLLSAFGKRIYIRMHILFFFQMQIVDLRVHYLHSKKKNMKKTSASFPMQRVDSWVGVSVCGKIACLISFTVCIRKKKFTDAFIYFFLSNADSGLRVHYLHSKEKKI